MPLTASLGMYDSDALREANDNLWAAVATRLRDAGIENIPDRLDRSRPLDAIWDDPSLLLAQTCGYPLTTRWKGRLRYVATPRYTAPGCEGIMHRSRVVVRADDSVETLKGCLGRRVAINDRDSNTGMNLLRAMVAPLADGGTFFGHVRETGSHAASARAVAANQVDLAAIDTVTFAHLEAEHPDLTGRLRTLAWTSPSPGLPFVTSMHTPRRVVVALRHAIRQALHHEARTSATALLLNDIEVVDLRRYDPIRTLARRAAELGYPSLS